MDDFQENDIELVTAEDRETVLAAYLPLRKAVSIEQIGRLDYMVDLGPKLELICLATVLAAHQHVKLRAKNPTRFSIMNFSGY